MNEIIKWLFAGSLGSVITFLYQYKEDKRKSHVDAITSQRVEWTKELKMNIAEFIASAQNYRIVSANEKLAIRMRLVTLMEKIELNLNPINDEFDDEFIKCMKALYSESISSKLIRENLLLDRFKSLSQSIVKIEWEGIKLEAKKGNPSKQEKLKLRRKWLAQ